MKKIKIPGILILGLVPVFTHLLQLGKIARNFPLKDDYRVFVSYLYYYLNAPDKFAAIILPENESHPVLMRLIVLFQCGVDGHQDFGHMLLLCNLFLAVFFTCLVVHFYTRKEYLPVAWVSLLVLNLVHYEMYFRNDVGAYQLLSFSFSVFLFYAAANYGRLGVLLRVLFFLIFVITPLGSINGIVANVLVVACFLVNKENRKAGMVTALLLLIQLGLIVAGSGEGKSLNVFENIVKYNLQLVYAYFLSMGGIFNLISNPYTWAVIAAVTAGIFGYTFYRLFLPWNRKLDFEKLLFLFCTISLALIVGLRYNYWMQGYVSVLESRYKIYGALIILLFFVTLMRRFSSVKWLGALVTVFLVALFCGGFYKGQTGLKFQQLEQITEAYNVYEGGYREDFARAFYINSEKKEFLEKEGIYSFKPARTLFDAVLTEENRLREGVSGEMKQLEFDPTDAGDWGGMPAHVNMCNFKVTGHFPVKKYYFVKFRGDSTSCIQYLTPPPVSLLTRLGEEEEPVVPSLSRDFYPGAFTGIDFSNFEIYGVDDLGL